MTSTRNNELMRRRREIQERQRRELAAVDDYLKAEAKEADARLKTAECLAEVVNNFGEARAMELLSLTRKDVKGYLDELPAADSDAGESTSEAAEKSPASSGQASVPGQTSGATPVPSA